MRAFMTGSADAIAHVQEGIIVDANPAWLDLFGLKDTAAVQSQPLMDYFGSHSHAALKGALVAALHGRWSDHSLKVDALQPGGRSLRSSSSSRASSSMASRPCGSRLQRSGATWSRSRSSSSRLRGSIHRRDFCTGRHSSRSPVIRITQPLKAGRRAVFYLELDKRDKLERDLGLLSLEEIADSAGVLLKGLLRPGDVGGRVTAHGFAVVLERGNARDLDAWGAGVVRRLSEQVFPSGGRSVSITAAPARR
jgi:hypothetical protein